MKTSREHAGVADGLPEEAVENLLAGDMAARAHAHMTAVVLTEKRMVPGVR